MSSKSIIRSTLMKTAAALRVDELALALRRWLVSGGQSPQMLVVEMHETPQQDEALLRQQLDWVSRHFTLVDLPTFVALWQEYRANPRAARNNKPPLLFTFDDGRLNNYTVAAPVLESYGARGVFFVVPEFVQCSPQQARQFYYSHIDTRHLPQSLPDEETRSMTPQQIADLSRWIKDGAAWPAIRVPETLGKATPAALGSALGCACSSKLRGKNNVIAVPRRGVLVMLAAPPDCLAKP